MASKYFKSLLTGSLEAFRAKHELNDADRAHFFARARENYEHQQAERARIREDVKRKQQRKHRLVCHLYERDGPKCFYCLRALGDDISIEHLLERSRGGTNDRENLRLAHKGCNRAVIGLSVIEKLQLRAERLAKT